MAKTKSHNPVPKLLRILAAADQWLKQEAALLGFAAAFHG
jgi:hypothetical protein